MGGTPSKGTPADKRLTPNKKRTSALVRAQKLAAKPGHVGFGKVEADAAKSGATDPAALAAFIGRKKYGAAGLAALAAKGAKKSK